MSLFEHKPDRAVMRHYNRIKELRPQVHGAGTLDQGAGVEYKTATLSKSPGHVRYSTMQQQLSMGGENYSPLNIQIQEDINSAPSRVVINREVKPHFKATLDLSRELHLKDGIDYKMYKARNLTETRDHFSDKGLGFIQDLFESFEADLLQNRIEASILLKRRATDYLQNLPDGNKLALLTVLDLLRVPVNQHADVFALRGTGSDPKGDIEIQTDLPLHPQIGIFLNGEDSFGYSAKYTEAVIESGEASTKIDLDFAGDYLNYSKPLRDFRISLREVESFDCQDQDDRIAFGRDWIEVEFEKYLAGKQAFDLGTAVDGSVRQKILLWRSPNKFPGTSGIFPSLQDRAAALA